MSPLVAPMSQRLSNEALDALAAEAPTESPSCSHGKPAPWQTGCRIPSGCAENPPQPPVGLYLVVDHAEKPAEN